MKNTFTTHAQPGLYWFRGEKMCCELLREVRFVKGALSIVWINQELPIETMQGHWRGPVKLFGVTN